PLLLVNLICGPTFAEDRVNREGKGDRLVVDPPKDQSRVPAEIVEQPEAPAPEPPLFSTEEIALDLQSCQSAKEMASTCCNNPIACVNSQTKVSGADFNSVASLAAGGLAAYAGSQGLSG